MKRVKVLTKYIFLAGISIVFLFPFAWMFLGAFKSNNEIWQTPYKLLPTHINLSEFIENLKAIKLYGYLLNSFIVGIAGTALILIVSSMFAYGVVFLNNRNMDRIFVIVIVTYMLPGAVTYVPSYVILAHMGLLNTLSGLVFSNLANVFAVFYFRQAFKKTSMDFVEAAKIDGANHRLILRHVILPLNKSAFSSVGLLTFIQLYNSYMWPSIMLTSQDKYLISQGLRQFFIQEGAYGMNWAQVMLASTITTLPILVILFAAQKWLMSAISQDSGIKF